MTQTKTTTFIDSLRSRPRVLILAIIGFALIAVAPVLVMTTSGPDEVSDDCWEVPVLDGFEYSHLEEDFGTWADTRGALGKGKGTVVAWSAEEDSTVWSHPGCIDDPHFRSEDMDVDAVMREAEKEHEAMERDIAETEWVE